MPSGEALRDAELRYYVILTLAVFGAFAAILWSAGSIDEHLARIAGFQAVSLLTGTGFASAHFERWPALAQLIILQLMVLGAMAGSTCGGVKSLRVLLGLRALRSAFSVVGHGTPSDRPSASLAGLSPQTCWQGSGRSSPPTSCWSRRPLGCWPPAALI